MLPSEPVSSLLLPALIAACGAPPEAAGPVDGEVLAGRLALGEPAVCEAPRASVTYEEVGAAWGLTGADEPADGARTDGGGVVVDDLDHDGDLDFVFTREEDEVRVFWREGDTLVPERLPGRSLGIPVLVDLDGDGWNDLVIGGRPGPVFHNQAGRLVLVGDLGDAGESMRGGVPADLDGDGDLDLLLLARGLDIADQQDTILWNDGDLVLRRDLTTLDPTVASRKGFDGIVFDRDGDGALDLYVVNDMGVTHGPNVLWHNEGGAFREAECACDLTMSGMGGSIGDYDGDGEPDLYLTGVWDNVLLSGAGDGTFVDTTLATGADPIDDGGMAWGSAWLDHDNDGQTDVLVARGDFGSGHVEGDPVLQPIHLMRQEEGVFRDVAPELGVTRDGLWRGVLPVELNGDGVLDLVVDAMDERPLLFLSEGCTDASWLAVEAPIGSVVRVDAGGRTHTAWVTSDQGYGAAGAPQAWFGLGEAAGIDRLEVTLPWGAGILVAEGPLAARRRVRVLPETF